MENRDLLIVNSSIQVMARMMDLDSQARRAANQGQPFGPNPDDVAQRWPEGLERLVAAVEAADDVQAMPEQMLEGMASTIAEAIWGWMRQGDAPDNVVYLVNRRA